MKTVDIHAAKTHLSSLLAEVAAGEEVIIAKAGKPLARLVPLEKPDVRKSFGMLKGKIWISDDFDEPRSCYPLSSDLPPGSLRSCADLAGAMREPHSGDCGQPDQSL